MHISGIIYFASTVIILLLLSIIIRRINRKNKQVNYNISAESISTFKEEKKEERPVSNPMPSEANFPSMPPSTLRAYIHIIMSVVISLVIIGFGIYLILREDIDKESKNWVYGALGTVIGYWLKK